MTETPTTTRPIDAQAVRAHVHAARFELGIREMSTDGSTVYFKIGLAHATAWVQVKLSALDLYEVEVFKLRGVKRTDLGSLSAIHAEDLTRALVAEWCSICSRKGW